MYYFSLKMLFQRKIIYLKRINLHQMIFSACNSTFRKHHLMLTMGMKQMSICIKKQGNKQAVRTILKNITT